MGNRRRARTSERANARTNERARRRTRTRGVDARDAYQGARDRRARTRRAAIGGDSGLAIADFVAGAAGTGGVLRAVLADQREDVPAARGAARNDIEHRDVDGVFRWTRG